ncbi:MAG: redoxin domain-containing protein [Methanothrix sp.]|nr:redoxin domain-containing protein [Methanothrix sp.]
MDNYPGQPDITWYRYKEHVSIIPIVVFGYNIIIEQYLHGGNIMVERTTYITPGETAPDFTLKDQYGQDFILSSNQGKKVLLSFHPLAATGVCTRQMEALEAHFAEINALNTVPVGISVDAVPSKKLWSDNMKLKNLRILADFWPHGEVIKKYGLFREKNGFSERANIIVGVDGKVQWVKVYEISNLPDIDEVINHLK